MLRGNLECEGEFLGLWVHISHNGSEAFGERRVVQL